MSFFYFFLFSYFFHAVATLWFSYSICLILSSYCLEDRHCEFRRKPYVACLPSIGAGRQSQSGMTKTSHREEDSDEAISFRFIPKHPSLGLSFRMGLLRHPWLVKTCKYFIAHSSINVSYFFFLIFLSSWIQLRISLLIILAVNFVGFLWLKKQKYIR